MFHIKRLFQLLRHRLVVGGVGILLQLTLLIVFILRFNRYFAAFYGISVLLSALLVIGIINSESNPAYKIAWIIPIMLVPVLGVTFYLIFGSDHLPKRDEERLHGLETKASAAITVPLPEKSELLGHLSRRAQAQSNYITACTGLPIFTHTQTTYFPLGEDKFRAMLEELEKAEHFIFMEYFIIQEGVMWNAIHDVLRRKAAQGVEIRLLFDDVGSLLTLPNDYDKLLESEGIACRVFNPFVQVLSPRLNNRDHRKILVIDGHTGFTGGINLADEYINAYPKHGHWKDTAVMLKGEAVANLTTMFLIMWGFVNKSDEVFDPYMPHAYHPEPFPEAAGFVQPFSDSPLDGEPIAENVYRALIERAERYVYITTPYLILDNEITTALCTAARQGIDVRIITPHVPDKWYVHAVTRANYPTLIKAGVKIYEYTPGFIHAKMFVSDDDYAVVGTINLDYRSLYLHFECGAWMYKTSCITDIRDDILKTQEVCQQITPEDYAHVPFIKRLGHGLLRVFAPLM